MFPSLSPPNKKADTFSTQDTIRNRFVSGNALSELEDLMNQVFIRRAEQLTPIPCVLFFPFLWRIFCNHRPAPSVRSSSFWMPSRVTLNDAKCNAWFADLGNPDVLLHKLGKSMPHGAKGHDLLDLLHARKVAIPQVVWYLRIFGTNKTVCKKYSAATAVE